ncbi:LAMI_0C09890g1_1 [Lachancea mirantina]|uniref:LAMI_0C09890g1_1 n=1 Tax=Lachancea mirantina TaxID=1230905 RepID=A0A1G4J5H1_9SACH|nr:LAMI_0C09890g1_1 [Lachancea mirantina]
MDFENPSNLSSTMELLSQYDNHTMERDKALESFERKQDDETKRATYDELYRDNVKLRLQLQEYETELASLKQTIEALRAKENGRSDSVQELHVNDGFALQQQQQQQQPVLPPRSAERKRNAKNLTLPVTSGHAPGPVHRTPIEATTMGAHRDVSAMSLPARLENSSTIERQVSNPDELSNLRRSSSSYSNVVAATPATSVAYMNSRISPSSSNKTSNRETALASGSKLSSPRKANRITALINDQLHSPLRQPSTDEELNTEDEAAKVYPKSPLPYIPSTFETVKISPASKQNIHSFAELMDDKFGQNLSPSLESRKESPEFELEEQQASSKILGSPLALKKQAIAGQRPFHPKKDVLDVISTEVGVQSPAPSPSKLSTTPLALPLLQEPFSPKSPRIDIRPKLDKSHSMSTTQSPSSRNIADTQSVKSDVPLLVQPAELNTVYVEVISTLFNDNDKFGAEERCILLSVIDRSSKKEMFKFSKPIEKIYELDVYIKCHFDGVILPPLPEKQYFGTILPSKVDHRRTQLNDYFATLFHVAEMPPHISLRLAKFISTDMVMNFFLSDSLKEGFLMMRKSKAIGSSGNWRLRYAVLESLALHLYEKNQVTDTIRLPQSSIELQANYPDDRYGTKNGFIVSEHKKSGLSSFTKYYLCCESAKDREAWIASLTELMDVVSTSNASINSKSEASSVTEHSMSNDVSFNSNASYIGPPATLQPSMLSSPTQKSDLGNGEDEKENKRSRIRSFFPFKKLNMAQTPTFEYEGQQFGEELQEGEISISSSLQLMNLDREVKPVFGSDLKSCLSLSSHTYQGRYEIPSVIYRCLEYLYCNHGIEEEGIFRISGSSALIKSLQEEFDRVYDVNLCDYNNRGNDGDSTMQGYVDVNTATGLLKLFLRKLPSSLLGDRLFGEFRRAVENSNDEAYTAICFRQLVNSEHMPVENRSVLFVIFELLVKINKSSHINKMNLRNLCIVFSPTLGIPVNVLQPFIVDFDCIFKGSEPADESQREKLDLHIPQL